MLSGDGKANKGLPPDIPAELSGRVQAFLASVGIGGGGSGDITPGRRSFDAEPMLRFAMDEGLEAAAAEHIYERWVERQMEGAIESFEVVQSHIKRDCPLKVTARVMSTGLELFSKEAGGVVENIPYETVARYKKLVDGVALIFLQSSILEKARTVKLECPQPGNLYQAIQNKIHEVNQDAANAIRTHHFSVLWDFIDETVAYVKNGFSNLKQLERFVRKRAEAERELAGKVLEMASGSTGSWGGRSTSLEDLLSESGRVNEAWATRVSRQCMVAS